jgi:CBS-domain-containing membrane protein
MRIFTGKEKLSSTPSGYDMLRGFIGGSLSILALLLLGDWSGHLLIMAPFGASCVLLYAASQSPLAQPRNIIFGHLISAAIGLCFLKWLGVSYVSIAFSVGAAIACMQYFRCVHPPAGANPLVILLSAQQVHYDWSFLVFPVAIGACILVGIAYILNNLKTKHQWPMYGLALWRSKLDQ